MAAAALDVLQNQRAVIEFPVLWEEEVEDADVDRSTLSTVAGYKYYAGERGEPSDRAVERGYVQKLNFVPNADKIGKLYGEKCNFQINIAHYFWSDPRTKLNSWR